jgi:zinc/manganese transport system substrate-binding protein
MLQAAATTIVAPFTLQAAIMNGTDPSPQDVTTQNGVFTGHQMKVVVYNQQVTDPLTRPCLPRPCQAERYSDCRRVKPCQLQVTLTYPGLLGEGVALRKAVTDKVTTETLLHGSH